MRFPFLLFVLASLAPLAARAEDINISNCTSRRPISLSTDAVVVVKTFAGPAAAIQLTSITNTEVSYRWRYRESPGAKVTVNEATFLGEKAKKRASIEKAYMDVGRFVIEWNLNGKSLDTLYYCPTLALVEYYLVSEFGQLPP